MKKTYGFPLCIQLNAPLDLKDSEFNATLEQLQELDFYGVELNVINFEEDYVEELKQLLEKYNLKLTMLATGGAAKEMSLSLSSEDEEVRKKTVDTVSKVFVPFAKEMKCGIICGFIKGGIDVEKDIANEQLRKSIDEINNVVSDEGVDIYLEATNHYESSVVNTLSEGAKLVKGVFKVLPDTYHMNIEETSMASAIVEYASLYNNIHISDNNRYFPGIGEIDFYQILSLLKALSYKGTISIEGRNVGIMEEDIDVSSRYLRGIASRLK